MPNPAGPSRLLPTPFAGDYTLEQVFPAQAGWRVVTWDGLRHQTEPVYLLALATNAASSTPGLIVSLTYTPPMGWHCPEDEPGYCGLLPPGWDLGRYEAQDPNGHVPVGP